MGEDRYPGEPTPASMVSDLQAAIYGHSFAVPRSPEAEWQRLLLLVRRDTQEAKRILISAIDDVIAQRGA